jgi:hypothetical protein
VLADLKAVVTQDMGVSGLFGRLRDTRARSAMRASR